jgi:hypothetical protein
MSDYARKIKETQAVLENTQIETALLLRPYDVTRVQNPITEDVTDWSAAQIAAQYAQAVKEHTSSTLLSQFPTGLHRYPALLSNASTGHCFLC